MSVNRAEATKFVNDSLAMKKTEERIETLVTFLTLLLDREKPETWRPRDGERFLAWNEANKRWAEGYWRDPETVGSAIFVPWKPTRFAPMPITPEET